MDALLAQHVTDTRLDLAARSPVVSQELIQLCTKYQELRQAANLLTVKIAKIDSLVGLLHDRLDKMEPGLNLPPRAQDTVRDSFSYCLATLVAIELFVMYSRDILPGLPYTERSRYDWVEATIANHIEKLDSQIDNLTSIMNIIQRSESEGMVPSLDDYASLHLFRSARDSTQSYETIEEFYRNYLDNEVSKDGDIDVGSRLEDVSRWPQKYPNSLHCIWKRRRSSKYNKSTLLPDLNSRAMLRQNTQQKLELLEKFKSNGSASLVSHSLSTAEVRHYSNRLRVAIQQGDIECVEMLIERGADVNYDFTADNGTPLHLACGYQSEYRANITPLQLAVVRNKPFLISTLLKAGADHTVKLPFTICDSLEDTLKHQLRETELAYGLLHIASAMNHTEVLRALYSSSLRIMEDAGHGWLPLHAAALTGANLAAEYLLQRGAAMSEKAILTENYLGTPLHIAALQGFGGLAKTLTSNCVDLEAKIYMGTWASLHHAVAGMGRASITYKVSTDSHISISNHEKQNYPKLMKILLEAGADANVKDLNGHTPIFRVLASRALMRNASKYSVFEAVRLLLDKRIHLDDEDPELEEFLSLACKHADVLLITFLAERCLVVRKRHYDLLWERSEYEGEYEPSRVRAIYRRYSLVLDKFAEDDIGASR